MNPLTFTRNVSRETSDKLNVYAKLLVQWNRRINLVSPSSLSDLASRHFQDSARLSDLSPPRWSMWVDLGSGGGFPGLVVAILALDQNPQGRVILLESDKRKATFLRTVIRETGANATVRAERIEVSEPANADVVSARALAPLDKLLGYGLRHVRPGGRCLLMKGRGWEKEVQDARREWQFSLTPYKSETDETAAILQIEELSHV